MAHSAELIIYDLDGVITDTAEFHFLAWKQLAEELDITFDRRFNERLKGISRMDSLELILALGGSKTALSMEKKLELAARKNGYYLELIEEISPGHILPGIKTLLDDNKQAGVKIALGSASKNAPHILDMLELSDYFDYIVDAAQVQKGKPDPETFTNAADALGVAYENCIGVEDAAAGVDAINSAGMFSVAVGDQSHLGHAHYRVDDTKDLMFENMIQCFQDWRKI
ncbi:beta-phosphoglucomutase [Planococcus alpniumensis]|uniref:beta-phosphoglucomutase n=1 Tax=Planococcus alpniumensis TaxID=2708345 RepID=UPI001B8AD0A9|nr:beta-phosphoglucomutase [Planococcus sp. MSAK28401]